MHVEVYKLEPHDVSSFQKLVGVYADVFEMDSFTPPGVEYLQRLLLKNSFFVFVATVSGEIVGGTTCYVLEQYYNTSSYVYVYDLAVHPRFQRLGFGRRLMQAVMEHSQTLGAEEVFVQADDSDLHAIEFYRNSGGIPEKVTHFNYPLRTFIR